MAGRSLKKGKIMISSAVEGAYRLFHPLQVRRIPSKAVTKPHRNSDEHAPLNALRQRMKAIILVRMSFQFSGS